MATNVTSQMQQYEIGLGLLLGTEAPVITPNGIDFSFLSEIGHKLWLEMAFPSADQQQQAVLEEI